MKKSQLRNIIKEEIRSTLNEGIGDKVLDKIFDFFKHDLYDDLKLSHDQALKLTDLIGDLIEKELKTAISEYSLKQPTGGYVNTEDTDINMFLHQIAKARGNDLTNNKMKLKRENWEDIIELLGNYLESKFNFKN